MTEANATEATLRERIRDEIEDPDDCAHGHPSCRKCLFERREALLSEAVAALDAKDARIARLREGIEWARTQAYHGTRVRSALESLLAEDDETACRILEGDNA